MRKLHPVCLSLLLLCVAIGVASAQSFRVQCPTTTITHPNAANNNSEPTYVGPTYSDKHVYPAPPDHVNGAIKCQQISGGDGYATMGDGTQTYLFAFGPLSGLADMAAGLPGTQFPNVFNDPNPPTLLPGDPATTGSTFTFNGAVGLAPDTANVVTITNILEGTPPVVANPTPPPANFAVGADYCAMSGPGAPGPHVVTAYTNAPLGAPVGAQVVITNGIGAGVPTPPGYAGTFTITCVNNHVITPDGFSGFAFTYTDPNLGLPPDTGNDVAGTASTPSLLDGHVDPRPIMDVAVMNGNMPAPLMAFDEDDEFFLTLTNVGQIMRPDLFEQHTVHFHGYPNASAFYDGVPDASVAINIGGSFTYYYLAPDAGTYFWHCHITPPEHLQMGMVGQLYVRPRQNRVPNNVSLYTARATQDTDLRTACVSANDILCSNPLPAVNTGLAQGFTANGHTYTKYAYNDGDGSTAYDVEYPLQIHGFDPNFHFVGMTFNPEGFTDMKDKYFLLNGRSYPDTVTAGPLQTQAADGVNHFSQPLPAIINIPANGKALLRIASLDVSEYQTLASLGIPMKVIALNAKLLRDQAGHNLYYNTNSITLAGGESLDVILDATGIPVGTYFLYTPNLDHLSNDAENFGGLMTEVHVCSTVVGTTFGNTCN